MVEPLHTFVVRYVVLMVARPNGLKESQPAVAGSSLRTCSAYDDVIESFSTN